MTRETQNILSIQLVLTISILIVILSGSSFCQDSGSYELDYLTQLIAENPNDPELFIDRGLVYNDSRQHSKAIQDFTTAINLDPQNIDAYYFRGLAYGSIKKHDMAIKDYKSILSIDQSYVDAYRMIGYEYFEMKQYDKAMEQYDIALQMAPDDPLVYLYRGDVYLEQKNYNKAEENYKIAVDLDPGLISANEMLSYTRSLMQESDKNNDNITNFDNIDTSQWFTDEIDTSSPLTDNSSFVNYTYTESQYELINQAGSPEGFTISICTMDEESEKLVRNEVWYYYNTSTKFLFLDGELIYSEEIDPIDSSSILTPYTPAQFNYGMNFQDVLNVTGEQEFVLSEVIDEFVASGDIYFTEQLVLGFKDEILFFIESLPLIPGEEGE